MLPQDTNKVSKDLTIEIAMISCVQVYINRVVPRGFDKDCKDVTNERATTSYSQAGIIKVLSQGTVKNLRILPFR
jgi:hypothetical protein